MAAATHNLILVNRPLAQAPKDFNAIAARMAALAPEIAVHLVHADTEAATLPVSLWEKPVLAVSMLPPGRFRPCAGAFCMARIFRNSNRCAASPTRASRCR